MIGRLHVIWMWDDLSDIFLGQGASCPKRAVVLAVAKRMWANSRMFASKRSFLQSCVGEPHPKSISVCVCVCCGYLFSPGWLVDPAYACMWIRVHVLSPCYCQLHRTRLQYLTYETKYWRVPKKMFWQMAHVHISISLSLILSLSLSLSLCICDTLSSH